MRAGFRSLIKAAAHQSAPRSGFSGKPRRSLRVAPASLPLPRSPPPTRACNWNYPALLNYPFPGTRGCHAGAGITGWGAALRRWQEVTRLSPTPAWQCQQPLWVRQRLPSCRIRGEQRGGGWHWESPCPCGCPGAALGAPWQGRGCASGHRELLCCARLGRARLCPAVPNRAQRREQSLPKALSPPCLARHPLVCILRTPLLNNFGVIFPFWH